MVSVVYMSCACMCVVYKCMICVYCRWNVHVVCVECMCVVCLCCMCLCMCICMCVCVDTLETETELRTSHVLTIHPTTEYTIKPKDNTFFVVFTPT